MMLMQQVLLQRIIRTHISVFRNIQTNLKQKQQTIINCDRHKRQRHVFDTHIVRIIAKINEF